MQEKRGISKLIIGLVLLFVGGGLLIWALLARGTDAPSSQEPNSTSTSSSEEVAPADVEGESSAIIAFTKTGFAPDELTVKKGATVTVRNESDASLEFSSDEHPTHQENSELNLKELKPGENLNFAPNKAGTWGFHDHLDPSKTGQITVTE